MSSTSATINSIKYDNITPKIVRNKTIYNNPLQTLAAKIAEMQNGINGIDIDWNGANINGDTLNNTSQLLQYVKTANEFLHNFGDDNNANLWETVSETTTTNVLGEEKYISTYMNLGGNFNSSDFSLKYVKDGSNYKCTVLNKNNKPYYNIAYFVGSYYDLIADQMFEEIATLSQMASDEERQNSELWAQFGDQYNKFVLAQSTYTILEDNSLSFNVSDNTEKISVYIIIDPDNDNGTEYSLIYGELV